MSRKRKLVVCETIVAITLHLRELGEGEEPNYRGFTSPKPKTLCGAEVGWDTRISPEVARCGSCLEKRKRLS